MDIQLFGRFAVQANRPIRLQTNKIRGLVAYLAVHANKPVERTHLAFLFWPEKTDSVAARNLRNSLSRLRKAFKPLQLKYGDDLLIITRRTVQLSTPQGVCIDSVEFDQQWQLYERGQHADTLRQLVAHYQGEFLAGLQIDDSIEFDSWVTLLREKYHRQMLQALAWLVEHEMGVEGWDSAEKHAHRALELEQWHETAHRQLITLYCLTGQRNKAEAQFKRCKQVMWEAFGSEPQPDTVAALRVAPKPTATSRHNLPPEPNPFLGREAEIEQLQQLLTAGSTRLITLHGEGGIGKTRLARSVGATLVATFVDGVFFVPLVSVNAASEIAATIVKTLDIPQRGNSTPIDQLCDYLQTRKMLLIIDNLEHLLDDDDETVDCLLDLLDAAPQLILLITSRQQLWVQAETVVRLHELPYPSETTDDRWTRYAAVQLFITRMRQNNPSFDLATHREAIVQICQAVGGLPLGIELAAAQSGLRSCAGVAAQLREGLRLRTRMRDVPKRQRSLQNVFDYSWKLLEENVRPILTRCAIMRGDFDYNAFHAVTGGRHDDLETLITHALVRHVGEGRYDLHELIRQVAASRLDSAERTQHAFIDHYFQFAQTQAAMMDADPEPTVVTIRREWAHIQQAWAWAIEMQAVEPLHKVIFALLSYWSVEHNFNVAERLVCEALFALKEAPHPLIATTRPRLQAVYAYALDKAGQHEEAIRYATTARMGTDPEAVAAALFTLGNVEGFRGNHERAQPYWEQLIDHAQRCSLQRWQLLGMEKLSRILSNSRQYTAGRQLAQEAIALARQSHNRVLEMRLFQQMGWVHLHEWELSEAVEMTLQYCHIQAKLTTMRDPFSADWRLSRIYFLLGDYTNAVATLRQVEDASAIDTDINLQVLGRAFYSYALRMNGQLQKAVQFAQLAVAALRQWNDAGIPHMIALNALATAQWAANDTQAATATIERAEQILLQRQYEIGFQQTVYATQTGLYVDIQQFDKARRAALKLVEILTQRPTIEAEPRSAWYAFLALRDVAPASADQIRLRGREAAKLRLSRITNPAHRDIFANIPVVKLILAEPDQVQGSTVHLARIGSGA